MPTFPSHPGTPAEATQTVGNEEEKKCSSEPSFWSEEDENSDGSNHSNGLQTTAKHSSPHRRAEETMPPRSPVLTPLEIYNDEDDSMDDSSVQFRVNSLQGNGKLGKGLSIEDIEICKRLDLEYERALEEREIGYNARYQSVRQSACFSITFMFFYLCLGIIFYTQYAGWTIETTMFFLVYTITTVGFGSVNFPSDRNFQLFTICYIFAGIATLTIMVAQVYQCIALEATRAQHARDKAELAMRGKGLVDKSRRYEGMISMQMSTTRSSTDSMAKFDEIQHPVSVTERCLDWFSMIFEKCRWFVLESEIGRAVSFVFPLAGLVALGACVVGPLEGWSVVESVYFACVALTTVGYGEYVPSKQASIWFCVCWLPCSVGFMSIYLGNIAAFYIRLSDQNIHRLERNMRRRIKRAKDVAAQEMQDNLDQVSSAQTVDMGSDDAVGNTKSRGTRMGFESLDSNDEPHPLFRSTKTEAGEHGKDRRRQRILEQSNYRLEGATSHRKGQTMQTMRDILVTVKASNYSTEAALSSRSDFQTPNCQSNRAMDESDMRRKPSFALRALVQERFAEIIATDIAGFQSNIEITGNTLSVTINPLKGAAEKWLVPRRARKAFRAVAFESLYFVGEHGLITKGADALFDLSPFEFHGLFGPLVAAMGDAETMEGWLSSTDVLADVDLRKDGTKSGDGFVVEHAISDEQRKVVTPVISPDSFTIT